ncbi:hypothetical protein QJQ45_028188 [Haematococcus lacustris]|nr:hypothetical protein QJQ45_028188 [Haematococcus lacustris]
MHGLTSKSTAVLPIFDLHSTGDRSESTRMEEPGKASADATQWAKHRRRSKKLGMQHLGSIDSVGGPVQGLTVIVTGPTSGIGKETAAALARRGAKVSPPVAALAVVVAAVVLACRNEAKGAELKADIEASSERLGCPRPQLEVRRLDLASLESVREFSRRWEAEQLPLHILINNAGVYRMGAPRDVTVDGFEAHMGSNYLGHFLLTMSLLPSLERGAKQSPAFGARVVSVSSSVHLVATSGIRQADPHLRQPGAYNGELAYAQSKLAQIQFTRELRRRLQDKGAAVQVGASVRLRTGATAAQGCGLMPGQGQGGVRDQAGAKLGQVFAVHPGMVLTEVTRTLPPVIQAANKRIMGLLLLSPAEGARATMYCATAPSAPLEAEATHGYFGANAQPLMPSVAAQSDAGALWLWKWSAQQVKLPPQLDLQTTANGNA